MPRAVWDEVVERRRDAPGADALRQATWIRVAENPAVDVNLGLDAGETSAIVLAEMLRADLLLIDERVGRSIARERGLEVCGTLGVLVLARQSDAVPALKPVLEFFDVADSQLAPIRSYNLRGPTRRPHGAQPRTENSSEVRHRTQIVSCGRSGC